MFESIMVKEINLSWLLWSKRVKKKLIFDWGLEEIGLLAAFIKFRKNKENFTKREEIKKLGKSFGKQISHEKVLILDFWRIIGGWWMIYKSNQWKSMKTEKLR